MWAICADTDEQARRIAASAKMMFTLLLRGQLIPVPPIEKALTFLDQQPKDDDPFRTRRRAIVGSPATVRKGLEDAAAEYDADELMIVNITYDHAERKRSYELIANAFTAAA